MHPILARYGSIFIYSYTIALATGVVLACLLTAHLVRDGRTSAWFDGLLALLTGAVVGGRLGFVASQYAYYSSQPAEVLAINQGGLAYYGAWAGGAVAFALWVRVTGRDWVPYAALYMPAIALVTAAGWAACWLDGCAYGRETTLDLWSASLPDEFGVFAVRYRTQFLGFALALLTLAALLWLRPRISRATLFSAALVLLGMAHLLPGLWRGDPTIMIGPLRVDMLGDALLVLAGLAGLQYTRWKTGSN